MSTRTTSYRNKLAIYVAGVFVLFALITLWVGVASSRDYKKGLLASMLAAYTEIVAGADSLSGVMAYIPESVRISVIDLDGRVVFDSESDISTMPNHLDRPEIRECLEKGEGSALRVSETFERKYFFYAGLYDGRIVRAARDFGMDVGRFRRTDWLYLLFIFVLLVFALSLLFYLSDRLARKEEEKAYIEKRRLKHEMTGNISHELKTPVSSIQGYLETIVNHPELDEDRRRLFIERSYLQSLRLSDMIADISTITKLEEAPEQFKITPVNVKTVFEEVMEELGESVHGHGIKVENMLSPVCVRGSYSLIYSIFRNLIENSMKYAGDGCTVHVSYSVLPHRSHCIDYYDTGRGVGEDELEKIFERFYRLDADRSKPVGGSGLGLSIARNAVLFHKGSIRAYSVPGGGLGFRFTLRDLK